jgi:hypothetical protein
MRSVPFLVLTAVGIIALGGFLITVYGKARYNEGVKHCELAQSKADSNEQNNRVKKRGVARKKVASIGDYACELHANGWLREQDCK